MVLNLNEENIKGGYFTVEETGIIKIDYLFDGGFYQGELAVFSVTGLQNSNLTIEQFISEAARRALSNTEEGYIIISDSTEGAKFNGIIPGEKDWNTGLYKGEKTLKMQSGDKFAFMLVPNGKVQQIFENPKLGGAIRPLFSLATANPSEALHLGQIAGINGNTFVMEDRRVDKDSDRDYNDIIFQVTGATGTVIQIDELINPQKEWRQTTIGQQILDYINTPPTPEDKEAPKIEAFLLNDTGSFNTDKITFDPTLKGTVTDNNKVTTFFAGFNENDISFDLTASLTENGEFTLNHQQLAAINGGELPDGNYTLYLQAGDSQNNLSEITEISFILDTTPPEITLKLDPTQDTGIPEDSSTELEIVNLVGKTEPHFTITLKETGKTTTADENGIFQFSEIQLQENENIFTVETTDLAGNQNQTTTTITRIPPAVPSLTLIEETFFKVTEEIALTIPETPSILNISLAEIYFDKTDTDSINDSLELALIDEKGNSLVHTIKPEKEAFFNWTEGETPLMGAGTSYSPQNQTISVNLTELTPNTEAKLIVRLINNDSDTTTTVSIKEISLKPAPQDAQVPVQTTTQPLSKNTAIPLLEFNKLEDISASIFPNYYTTTFNNKTSTIYADLALQNQGIYNINSPLLVGVTNISDPTVTVRNADGMTPEGIPYYNFSHLEKDGKLEAGETTEIGSLIFYNPKAVQ